MIRQCKSCLFILPHEAKELLELFRLYPNTIGWRQNSSSSAFASWGKIDTCFWHLQNLTRKCLLGIRGKSTAGVIFPLGESNFLDLSSGKDDTLLQSESPSSMCAKLHTVAVSNNRDHVLQSLSYACSCHIYVVLFFTNIPFIVNHTFNAHLRRGCNNISSFLQRTPHRSDILFAKVSHSTTFTSWSQPVAILEFKKLGGTAGSRKK